jgi:hypothetical protein
VQPATVAEDDMLAHDAVRPDLAVGANLSPGMDDGGRMDHLDFGVRTSDSGF